MIQYFLPCGNGSASSSLGSLLSVFPLQLKLRKKGNAVKNIGNIISYFFGYMVKC